MGEAGDLVEGHRHIRVAVPTVAYHTYDIRVECIRYSII